MKTIILIVILMCAMINGAYTSKPSQTKNYCTPNCLGCNDARYCFACEDDYILSYGQCLPKSSSTPAPKEATSGSGFTWFMLSACAACCGVCCFGGYKRYQGDNQNQPEVYRLNDDDMREMQRVYGQPQTNLHPSENSRENQGGNMRTSGPGSFATPEPYVHVNKRGDNIIDPTTPQDPYYMSNNLARQGQSKYDTPQAAYPQHQIGGVEYPPPPQVQTNPVFDKYVMNSQGQLFDSQPSLPPMPDPSQSNFSKKSPVQSTRPTYDVSQQIGTGLEESIVIDNKVIPSRTDRKK